MEFDWKYYLDKYPDLRINGVHTQKQAFIHWNNYGKKEGRIYNKYMEYKNLHSINDIKNIFYINLEHRTDRNSHIISQLNSVGLVNFERFNAIKHENGAIGCSMSHLKCLELAKERKYDHILICEDDTTFLNSEVFINSINNFFLKNIKWDVLLLGGNNQPPYNYIDETCIKVSHCQTTTCYIVREHYYDTLIDNFKLGLLQLKNEPSKHSIYAIDMYWTLLQKQDNWLLLTPLTVIQREDYSDIQKINVNYKSEMVILK
jgi:glycosyl transferase family 25